MFELSDQIGNKFYNFIYKNKIPSDLAEILKEDIMQDIEKIIKKIESWEQIVKGNK